MNQEKVSALADAMLTRYRLFLDVVVKETGIEPHQDNWQDIAFAIAEQHAPQLQDTKKAGRPAKHIRDKINDDLGKLSKVALLVLDNDSSFSQAVKIDEAVEEIGIKERTFDSIRGRNKGMLEQMLESRHSALSIPENLKTMLEKSFGKPDQ